MKKGSQARVVPPPPIVGQVVDRRINPTTDEEEMLLAWQENGQPVQRWFDADQLEEVQS